MNAEKKVSVVFIPDYLVDGLKMANMTLEKLDDLLMNYSDPNYPNVNESELNKALLESIPGDDLRDWIYANKIAKKFLLPKKGNDRNIPLVGIEAYLDNNMYTFEGSESEMIEEVSKTFIDKKIDILSIIMNNKDPFDNELFTLRRTGGTMFVIIHPGFMNFLIFGNLSEFKDFFISSLTNFLFKKFITQEVYNSDIFLRIINSRLQKN